MRSLQGTGKHDSLFLSLKWARKYGFDKIQNKINEQKFSNLRRMKTVLAHIKHETEEGHSIYNAVFDKTGRFIISGADDGLIKIWDRQTMLL